MQVRNTKEIRESKWNICAYALTKRGIRVGGEFGRGRRNVRTKASKIKVGGVGVGPGKRLHLWFPGEQQMEESV